MPTYPNYPFDIKEITLENQNALNIVTYLVASNAPTSVEINNEEDTNGSNQKLEVDDTPDVTRDKIKKIAEFLTRNKNESEVVIHIHGYNTRSKDFENWVKEIQEYITTDEAIKKKTIAFIGYYWPSEYINFKSDNKDELVTSHLGKAIRSLPIFFKTIYNYSSLGLIAAFAFILALFGLSIDEKFSFSFSGFAFFLFTLGIAFFACLFGYVLGAILLRVSIYFRDNYRAVNYGVPDLVEFIRQIDNAIIEQAPGDVREQKKLNFAQLGSPKIKLSFIAHSMGAFVTTNVIRILSDIFDENSIPKLSQGNIQIEPSPNIGNVFSLGRLVLASPDIPIETIMPERSNFLRSSLRRFNESYLFSSQGDVILRVASTAANYISFPANTYDRGFRLGNIVVDKRIFSNSTLAPGDYGIVNQNSDDGSVSPNAESAMNQIGIVSDNQLKSLSEILSKNSKVTQNKAIAGLFTYFDCTDYRDTTIINNKPEGVLTRGLCKDVLSFWDCLILIFDSIIIDKNVHGGYFQGDLSRKMLYRLAFLGYKDFLFSLKDEPDYQEIIEKIESEINTDTIQTSLQNQDVAFDAQKEAMIKLSRVLSHKCKDKGIKVFLAPERYLVDMLEQPRNRKGY
jgi:esterase/lipase superfamily enzyme